MESNMKKLIVFIVFLGAFGCLLAQHNTPVPESGTLTAKVIKPFYIMDITNTVQGGNPVPEAIKGQKRILTPPEGILLFEMGREAPYIVDFNLYKPADVDGVKIVGWWEFYEEQPPITFSFPGHPLNQNWYWEVSPRDIGWITFKITEIDARNATSVGVKKFTVNARGKYRNL
jgi:hypothetical protein